jgi:hypothetical protein
MSYLNEAFGGFDPRNDVDAAVKFVLNLILMDVRFDELKQLLTEGHQVGALAGDPGWVLERRDEGYDDPSLDGAAWPDAARYRAFVDPRGYELAHSEYYMSKSEFREYVTKAINAYAARHPGDAQQALALLGTA